MARKLSHAEFTQALVTRRMPLERLADYVAFDTTTAIPKLIFRADALRDVPPKDYDVDEAIYRYQRVVTQERRAQQEAFAFTGAKCVVAEGDSWFNLPLFLRPPAIADWIELHRKFRVNNIARWGHTMRQVLHDREYIAVLSGEEADYFLFTAEGNDLQEGLESGTYIHPYDPGRATDDYLTSDGLAELGRIEQGFHNVFAEVSAKYPKLPMLCHAYDYPRPLVGGGAYIGQFLRRKGIPNDLMAPLMKSVVDKLNVVIGQVATSYGTATFLDCRGVTEAFTWYDDMHPASDGFEMLANRFESVMNP